MNSSNWTIIKFTSCCECFIQTITNFNRQLPLRVRTNLLIVFKKVSINRCFLKSKISCSKVIGHP